MTTLFIRDNTGALRTWSIYIEDNGLLIEHGLIEGAKQTKFEHIDFGKASRTKEEQIELQKQSRINKMLDKGYVYDLDEAMSQQPRNRLGLVKPMLALPFQNVEINFKDTFIQRKYDGNRCIIANICGENIAYSRNGKQITSIDHILDNINLAPGDSIDGELYCHGVPLQTIVSWIKRKQENTDKLQYIAYDYISTEPFVERLERLEDLVGENIEVAPTVRVANYNQVSDLFEHFREEGYEGAIVRWGTTGYEDGKRSKFLLKVKEWHDDNFTVIDIMPSKDGWAVLLCKIADKRFSVSAPGTIVEKTYVYRHKEQYIGKSVAVDYAYLTAEGIPFHPVARRWL